MDVDQIKTLRAHERTCAPDTRGVFQGASGNGRREGGKMKIWRLLFIHGKIQAKAAARYAAGAAKRAAVRAEAKAAEAAEVARRFAAEADGLAREGRGPATGAA